MLKCRLNIMINESAMCTIFRDPWSRDRELKPKKKQKTAIFASKIY